MNKMRKGINALELVFAMFILIVVSLVVIRLFINIVTTRQITEPLQDIKRAANYDKEVVKCSNICERYTAGTNPCTDTRSAVEFCLTKVSIDIDNNGNPGEKGHGGVIVNLPYCEDGLYCFNIKENCACGSQVLNPKTCLQILKDFYINMQDLDSQTAERIITNAIQPGTCDLDPTEWPRQVVDYEKITGGLKANWWWVQAGYDQLSGAMKTTTTGPTSPTAKQVSFSCAASGNKIRCSWANCQSGEDVNVGLTNGEFKIFTDLSGSTEFGPLSPGTYQGLLSCKGFDGTSNRVTISG